MEIFWLGQSCFKIRSKDLVLVTDPFSPEIGLKMPKTEADIITVSHSHFDHNNIEAIGGNPFVIDGPGEYEIKGINIVGVETYHDDVEGHERGRNTIYIIEIEDLRICHLGDLGHNLSNEILEKIDGVDILMIPTGGLFTLDSAKAQEVISQISPKIVIPMHYKIDNLKINLDGVDKFCKEMGASNKPQDKLVIKKANLSEEEEEKIVILNKK